MNLSTLFFDRLSRTDSNLAINGKKSIEANFFFHDLIKVFEDENTSSNDISNISLNDSNEIYSPNEKVVSLSGEEFNLISNLIESLINVKNNIEVEVNKYKIEDTEISKEHFIVNQANLVSLISSIFNENEIKPAEDIGNIIANNNPIILSFKSDLNKISISINPIQISSGAKIKETVELLIASKILTDSLDLNEKIESNIQNEENKNGDEKLETENEKYFKVEIVKISSLLSNAEKNTLNNSVIEQANKKTQQENFSNDKIITEKSQGFSEITNNNLIKNVSNDYKNETNLNFISFNDLIGDLTEEEKSVFKNLQQSNELKSITIKKVNSNLAVDKLFVENPRGDYNIELSNTDINETNTTTSKDEIISQIKNSNENVDDTVESNKSPNIISKSDTKSSIDENNEITINQQAKIRIEKNDNSTEPYVKANQIEDNDKKENEVIEETLKAKNLDVEKIFTKVSNVINVKNIKSVVNENNISNTNEVAENDHAELNEKQLEKGKEVLNDNPDKKINLKNGPETDETLSQKTTNNKIVNENIKSETDKQIQTSQNEQEKISKLNPEEKANLSNEKNGNENKNHFQSNNEQSKNEFNQLYTSNNLEFEKVKQNIETKPFYESTKNLRQEEIIPEFTKFIQQGEKQTISFQLTPENLGKVNLTIDLVDNFITTKIEVENEQVKQFIQSNIEQLKANLQSSGIQLNNVNISLADYSQKQNQKVYNEKRKNSSRIEKEKPVKETASPILKKNLGYNTLEFLA
ncbi:MAG: flagellar hook-length control protein FliK [Stygiobacter sp.]